MKLSVKATVFTAFFVSLSLCAAGVQARDDKHLLPIKDALELGKKQEGKWHLDEDIAFYFGDQSHPAVDATLVKGVITNKKTNAANKSDEEACNFAMLSALIQLQERARSEGGNAVINIESYFKKISFKSKDQFECHAGAIMAGVALRGDVVKLKK
ncbi:MAG: excinuclease ATPase subunit [Proteobacteria bacterium]|nr:excinuclease ATPase subunit [Pseudomonadota bacterium]